MLKYQSLLLALTLVSSPAFCGQKTISNDGKVIELKDDGSWKEIESHKTPFIEGTFQRSPSFLQLSYGEKEAYGVWYDSGLWMADKPKTTAGFDLTFTYYTHKSYVFTLWRPYKKRTDEELFKLAESNAYETMLNVKLISEEKRPIQGVPHNIFVFEGTKDYIPLIWHCAYISTDQGTLQVVTYTPRQFYEGVKFDIIRLLDGITLSPPSEEEMQVPPQRESISLLPPELEFLNHD
jgi:hypothetical protein